MGAFGNFATEGTGFENLFPGITNTLLTLNGNFRMPLYKEYLQALGLASVSRRSCEALLCIRSKMTCWQKEQRPRQCHYDCYWRSRRILACQTRCYRINLEKTPWISSDGNWDGITTRPDFILWRKRYMPIEASLIADLFQQAVKPPTSRFYKFQEAVKRLTGFTTPLVWARGVFNYDFGLMPWRHQINTVGTFYMRSVPERQWVNLSR